MIDRWNGSCVICHDLMRGLLLERCHLWMSHSWPLWNKSRRRQTVCACPCVNEYSGLWLSPCDRLRGSSVVSLFVGLNHAWWALLPSPQWCKKIPLWTLKRWSLTLRFSFSVSFFIHSSSTFMAVTSGAWSSSPKIFLSSLLSFFHSLRVL